MNGPADIRHIVTVEVPVRDLSRAIRWYEESLGLRSAWRAEGRAMLRLPSGGTRLFLVEVESGDPLGFTARSGAAHSVVDFYTPDLMAAHRHLRAAGVEVDDLSRGARGFGVTDPDGNRLGVCDIER